MKKINVDGKNYDILEERDFGQSVCDRRKEILFHNLAESKFYLFMSYMEGSLNATSDTRMLLEKNTILELTEEQMNSWKNRNLNVENIPRFDVTKAMIIS